HSGFFFCPQESPSGEGLKPRICIIMHMVPPGEFSPVPLNPRHSRFDNQRLYRHQSPLRSGGFTMQDFFNKIPDSQTIINLLNCEVFKNLAG
ncbi:hypothetical protein LZ619_24635, partial [Escherichia coli]|nr:hypothetical protein [Escherichia coli]MCE9772981.1 hypothetical protein [Escherichia coli]MCE9808178.1 hypothetical protein [Escherichia coli]